MSTLSLTASSTALVLIDLQQGIVARELAPYSATQVVKNARRLADAFRQSGGTVVFVRVNINEIAPLTVDSPMRPPGSPPVPASASELAPETGVQPGDIVVVKKQWGAFYGTDLDQHLRRRKITTIVLGGIATNFGVESTARAAAERAYEQVFAEDAMTSMSAEAHAFSIKHILPRIGRVRSTEEILGALTAK
jgi:nicotinamidase-related amidase